MNDRTLPACMMLGAALLLLPSLSRSGQEPAAAAAAVAPVLRYEIWVELDAAGKMLTGKEEIVWTNPTKDAVPDMLFHLYWNAFKNEDSAYLREAEAETMFGGGSAPKDGDWGWIDITDIRLADGSDLKPSLAFVTPDGPDNPGDQTVARVLFPAPVGPGESVRMRIEFRSKIPRTVARSGYYQNSFFIGQWFPKPGVYEEGKGWNCHAIPSELRVLLRLRRFHRPHHRAARASSSAPPASPPETEVDEARRHDDARPSVRPWSTISPGRPTRAIMKIERDFVAAREVTAQEYEETAELLGLPVDEVTPARRQDDPAHRPRAQGPGRAPFQGPARGHQVLRPLVRALPLRDGDHGRPAFPDRQRRHGVPDPVHGRHAGAAERRTSSRRRGSSSTSSATATGTASRPTTSSKRPGSTRASTPIRPAGSWPPPTGPALSRSTSSKAFPCRLVPPDAQDLRLRDQPGGGHPHRPLRPGDRLVLEVL